MKYSWRQYEVSVHPSAWIAQSAEVIGNVVIEKDASIFFQSVIRGDKDQIIIGEGSNIQDHCTLHTDPSHILQIGKKVTIGHGCILHGCTIKDECLIGMGAIVLNGAIIESHCIVGAGAVVTEGMHIPSGSVVIGVPAKIIKRSSTAQIQEIQKNAQHYIELSHEYQKKGL